MRQIKLPPINNELGYEGVLGPEPFPDPLFSSLMYVTHWHRGIKAPEHSKVHLQGITDRPVNGSLIRLNTPAYRH